MNDAGNFVRFIQSGLLFVAVCLIAMPLILLRLFGVLFFGGTISMWATVPALTLGALMVVAAHMPLRRVILAMGLMAAYLCSILFDGWLDMKVQLDEGQNPYFQALEAALIFILFARCLSPFHRMSITQYHN